MTADDMQHLNELNDAELSLKIESAELDIEEAQAVIAACKKRLKR